MKNIIIISVLALIASCTIVYSACKVEELGSCTVGFQEQNPTIKDKLVPNRLEQLVNPTRNSSREFKAPPHFIPETINTDSYNNPENQEMDTPYNSACQFGVCLPGHGSGTGNLGK